MNTKTTMIHPSTEILDSTIVEHFSTADTVRGYLVQNGTQRTLRTARVVSDHWNPDGYGVVFAKTNGDWHALVEGEGDEFLELIADRADGEPDIDVARAALLEVADQLDDLDLADFIRDNIV